MDRDKIRCRRADVVFVLGSLRFCRRVFVVPRGAMGVEPDILLGLDAIQAVHGQIDTTLSGWCLRALEAVAVPATPPALDLPGLSEKAERDLLDAVRAMRGDVTVRKAAPVADAEAPPQSVVTASLSAGPMPHPYDCSTRREAR
eukprot:tig00001066_g6750.t1